MDSDRFLRVTEFALRTRLSEKTVWRRLKAGQLPARQPGGPRTTWLIDYQAFLATLHAATESLSREGCAEGERIRPTTSRTAEADSADVLPGPRPRWMRLDLGHE
jgi:predicted DNA-binding transcriptional regulator AlpA